MPYTKFFNEMKLQLKVKDQSEQGNSLGTTPVFSTMPRVNPAHFLSIKFGPVLVATITTISHISHFTLTTLTGQF